MSLVAAKGMILAEGARLLQSDFIEQNGILCFRIKPHPWRSLKTSRRERVTTLVGSTEWTVGRILEQSHKKEFAFTSNNDGSRTNTNSANVAFHKWLKSKIRHYYTIHSFRLSMRDRLRAVDCPSAVADQIGGWLPHRVENIYAAGFPTKIF